MIKFFEVTFTNKLGLSSYKKCVGTFEQVNEYAIKESSANGWTYNIVYLCIDTLDGIKNLGNN